MKVDPIGATLVSSRLVEVPLGNGLNLRKVYVKYEEIVQAEDNIDVKDAKHAALTAAITKLEGL